MSEQNEEANGAGGAEHTALARVHNSENATDYVTFTIADQLFGIPVKQVQDVLAGGTITRIPLAPKEIAGVLNLRGRIVTAIDVRLRLGLPARERGRDDMSLVVDHGGELYSLMVDNVGDVYSIDPTTFDRNPPTLDPKIRDFSAGIYRRNEKLMVVLDVERLLDYEVSQAA